MITLQLSLDDARFLCGQLGRHLERVDDELVHTDKREMQRELARDVARLRAVLRQLESVTRDVSGSRSVDAH
ncbi:MAG: hypothetical protein KF850_36525 [Labilithrix sp.]|nr:hypothetical protein [Labilithrix sp.]MBX3217595.1 hypothetical protein [Labilithrix sp.]